MSLLHDNHNTKSITNTLKYHETGECDSVGTEHNKSDPALEINKQGFKN